MVCCCKISISICVLVLAWSTFISCQVYSIGQCPDPPVQPYFDIQQYMGRWYEIERFLVPLETVGKCITADYTLLTDSTVKVENKGIDVVFGELFELNGIGTIPDPNEPAKLSIYYDGHPLPFVNYWVLDTDYDTYSLVYSCRVGLLVSRLENAWIFSRSNTLPSNIIEKLHQKMAHLEIDPKHFRTSNHYKCYEANDNYV